MQLCSPINNNSTLYTQCHNTHSLFTTKTFPSIMARNSSPSIYSNPQEYFGQPLYAASDKTIVPGIQFVEHEHYQDKLSNYLEKFEWDNWMHMVIGENYYPDLIVQFYREATIHTEVVSDPRIQCYIQGKRIQLNCEKLARIFNIPNEGQKVFFKKKFKDTIRFENNKYWHTILSVPHGPNAVKLRELKPEFLLLSKFISNNILPKGGHVEDVTGLACFIMHRIAIHEPINLPFIILNYMSMIIEDNQIVGKETCRALGYGLYLTRIFRRYGVDLEGIPNGVPAPPFGWSAVKYAYKSSPFNLTIKSCVDEQENEDVESTLFKRSFHRSQYENERRSQDQGTTSDPNYSQPPTNLGDYDSYARILQSDFVDTQFYYNNNFGNSGF